VAYRVYITIKILKYLIALFELKVIILYRQLYQKKYIIGIKSIKVTIQLLNKFIIY